MANLKFNPSPVQLTPKFQFARQYPLERFYERSPHFKFTEEVVGDLVVSDLDPFERRTIREAVVTTETTDEWDRKYKPYGIVTLSEDELLETLEAMDEGEPFLTPVRAYREAKFATGRRRAIPPVLEVPKFTITSLAGNLVTLKRNKALMATAMLQEPSGASEDLGAEQPWSRHVRDGLLAARLATEITAEVTVGVDDVHQVTEHTLRVGFDNC